MPQNRKKARQLAPAPSPASAMAFAGFFILFAIAGLAVRERDLRAPLMGAAIAPERSAIVGEGYGYTCSQIVLTSLEMNDCCSTMCKPYAKTDAYAPCWTSCYKKGLRELSVIV